MENPLLKNIYLDKYMLDYNTFCEQQLKIMQKKWMEDVLKKLHQRNIKNCTINNKNNP